MRFASLEQYEQELDSRGALPEGFSVSTVPLRFAPRERETAQPYSMNLSLIRLDEPTPSFGAVFTRSAFPGAPVLVGRRRLGEKRVRGVVVNNKVANVCAPGGEAVVEEILGAVASHAGGTAQEYFAASTGIIGWRLPAAEMVAAVPSLVGGLSRAGMVRVARAIMTTDAYPKVRAADAGRGRIVGIAKGAGMIEPNMATMLSFILSDCALDRATLRRVLGRCVDRSFNRISVDGDQSTSDMVVLLCSGVRGAVEEGEFERSLDEVCLGLSLDVVRNGEGVGHVVRVTVTGAPDAAIARGAAKAVVNSPLVKAAVYGNDPNVGRLIGALGDYLGSAAIGLDPRKVAVSLGGHLVFSEGTFRLGPELERSLAASLRAAAMPTTGKSFPPHEECVDVLVDLGKGSARSDVYGADLSCDYVKENADYRS